MFRRIINRDRTNFAFWNCLNEQAKRFRRNDLVQTIGEPWLPLKISFILITALAIVSALLGRVDGEFIMKTTVSKGLEA